MTDKEMLDVMRSMLEPIRGDIQGINTRLDRMDARLDKVDIRLDTMQGDIKALNKKVDDVEQRLTERVEQSEERIRVLIETDMTKRIDLVLEGHAELDERICQLRDLSDSVEDIQSTVDVLKHLSKE